MPGRSRIYTVEEDGKVTHFAITPFEARKYMARRIRELAGEEEEEVHKNALWKGQDAEEEGIYIVYDLPTPPLDVNKGHLATDGMELWRAHKVSVGAGYFFGAGEERVVLDTDAGCLHRVALGFIERCPVPDVAVAKGEIVRGESRRVVRGTSDRDNLLRSIEAFKFVKKQHAD